MSKYHDRTLEMLRSQEGIPKEQPITALLEWAEANAVCLPAAYVEWARLDGQRLLRKYSSYDWFEFEAPRIITTPEGCRGLAFHQENQGNFSKILLLGYGDDPPVLFAWVEQPPWVVHTEWFSDCVFAEIFDWQYFFEFDPDDPKYKEVAYYGQIMLKSDLCLGLLRKDFHQGPTTREIMAGHSLVEYRFWRSLRERITVMVSDWPT